jgi:hypothetical protein
MHRKPSHAHPALGKRTCLILGVLVFSTIPGSHAEERTYDSGTLNIKCTCKSPTVGAEHDTWHHIVKIPHSGFTIDLDKACATTYDNYKNGPDVLCHPDDVFVGVEYAHEK